MSDRVKLTDGRDVLSVPATAAHALTALGWERTDKPAGKAELAKPAARRRRKPAALEGVPTNADSPADDKQ